MSGRGIQPPVGSSAPEANISIPSIISLPSYTSVFSRNASDFAESIASATSSGTNSGSVPATSTTAFEPIQSSESGNDYSGNRDNLQLPVLTLVVVLPVLVLALIICAGIACCRRQKRKRVRRKEAVAKARIKAETLAARAAMERAAGVWAPARTLSPAPLYLRD